MNRVVRLSPTSKKWLHKLADHAPPFAADTVGLSDLIAWLSITNQGGDGHKNRRFRIESLRTSLLQDIYDSFQNTKEKTGAGTKADSRLGKIKLGFLALAGTVLAFCQGFDGIVSLLGSFLVVSSGVVFSIGLCFALLSVAVFYLFDLVDISKNLVVSVGHSNRLLDVFLEELVCIDKLRAMIDAQTNRDLRKEDKTVYVALVAMLQKRFHAFDRERDFYNKAAQNIWLRCAKGLTTALAGLFFFGGGFFAGQTLALTVAGFLVISVLPSFWPVVVVSMAVGLAAFSIYWFLQRPALENLIGRWVGLDKSRIDEFSHTDKVTVDAARLAQLEEKIQRWGHGHGVSLSPLAPLKNGVDKSTQCSPSVQSGFVFFKSPQALPEETSEASYSLCLQ